MKILLVCFTLFPFITFSQWDYIGTSSIGASGTSIAVPGEDTIFLGNYRSFDGGLTWTEIFDGTGSLDNYYNGKVGMVERNDTIFKTINSGDSWTQMEIIPGLIEVRYSDDADVLYAYNFGNYDDGGTTKYLSRIYKSSDGGVSWSNLSLTFPLIDGDSLQCDGMDVYSKDTVFLAMRSSSYTLHLYSTFDGGSTWDSTGMIGNWMENIEFVTKDKGFYTAYGYIYSTEDGGLTWDTETFCHEMRDLVFVDENNGFAGAFDWPDCDDSYYKTEDGGATWLPMELCNTCGDTMYVGTSIAAYSPTEVYAAAVDCPGVYKYVGVSCAELGQDELTQSTELFSLGQNPIQNSQNLVLNNLTGINTELTIIGLDGKAIFTRVLIPGQNVIKQNLSGGVYIVVVRSESHAQTEKIVIE